MKRHIFLALLLTLAALSQIQAQSISHLPDPFAWTDGSGRSTDFADWERHRSETKQKFYKYEIGEMPTTPKDSIEAWMDADTLRVRIHANGNSLDMAATIVYPEGNGPFPAMIGIGMPSGSLPPDMLKERGIAQIAFPFYKVVSHTQKRGQEPLNRLYPEHEYIGAYCAWPWGVSRLIDAMEIVGEKARIDLKHLGITGCSFAGKMALFSGAFDERIALTIAQEPGGGGAAAWRVSETLGNVETLGRTNYSWFIEDMRRFSNCVDSLPIDHHQLVALVCPRALLVLGNTDYEWLADESSYVSCQAARTVWETFGIADRMGFSIEGGHGHCQLPDSQRPEVGAFLDRFLLDKQADTNITRAEMFKSVDWKKWMWTK
ncbi:MAG: hypothetical protein HUK06_05930 [Bacteroidaceae bacterium]|nr:hypothetical protein [Bacteroidaceae bacterium]